MYWSCIGLFCLCQIVDGRLIFVEVAKNAEEVRAGINSNKAEDRG